MSWLDSCKSILGRINPESSSQDSVFELFLEYFPVKTMSCEERVNLKDFLSLYYKFIKGYIRVQDEALFYSAMDKFLRYISSISNSE